MATFELTQEEFNALFECYPTVRKAEAGEPSCPFCGNALSPDALECWNGATEYGTPYCTLEIHCDVCEKPIWRGGAWISPEDKEELVYAMREALEEQREPDWPREEMSE